MSPMGLRGDHTFLVQRERAEAVTPARTRRRLDRPKPNCSPQMHRERGHRALRPPRRHPERRREANAERGCSPAAGAGPRAPRADTDCRTRAGGNRSARRQSSGPGLGDGGGFRMDRLEMQKNRH